VLVALQDGLRIEADGALKSVDYQCPVCRNILHVRRRKGWITHFYHLVLKNCASEGEGPQHRAAKKLLGEEYRRRGYEIAYEWTLAEERAKTFPRAVISDLPDRRTDVIIWRKSGGGTRSYAVEIQDSHISQTEFLLRTRDWETFGVTVLWLVLPRAELAARLAKETAANRPFNVERYSPRLFERMIWNRYRQLCYLAPQTGLLFPARLSRHRLFKEKYVTFDQSAGDFAEAGGYEYESQRFVDLVISPPKHLSAIRIDATERYAKWQ
jgi:Competence protein CoiA-like family